MTIDITRPTVDIEKIIQVVARSYLYVPGNGEAGLIQYHDVIADIIEDGLEGVGFYYVGEETGQEYKVEYTEIDFTADMFYEAKLVDTSDL